MAKNKQKELNGTAHHEAGHAVVAYYLARPFVRATIASNANAGTLGHVLLDPGWGRWFKKNEGDFENFDVRPMQREILERAIMIGYAGMYAETHFYGLAKPTAAIRSGAQNDVSKLVNLAWAINGGSVEAVNAYLAWLDVRTKQLLTLHWPQVVAVAKALLDAKTMTGKQVIDVIRQSEEDQIAAQYGSAGLPEIVIS